MPAAANCVACCEHAVAAVRRDHTERDACVGRHHVDVRVVHRARVERGDLVVVEIGRDEGLCGVLVVERAHRERSNAAARRASGGTARNRCRPWPSAGHCRRAAAGCRRCCRHSRRNCASCVGTRNDTFSMWMRSGRMCSRKRPAKHHDGVVGHRAADQCCHRRTVRGDACGRTRVSRTARGPRSARPAAERQQHRGRAEVLGEPRQRMTLETDPVDHDLDARC